MSIRKKLHHLISGQLPDFVRAEYPDFVTFLEHYYTWMEKSGQSHYYLLNSDDWMDIDATLDVFIPEFRKQFANEFSDQIELSTRKLVKYINQYYESKGSENSTEMFFRFMFNDTASVTYPGDYILRASDGRWRRKKFIKVNNTNFSSNNIYALNASIITLRYLEFIPGAGNIERTVTTRCYDVFRTRPNIYQLEVDLDPDYAWPDYISLDSNLTTSLGSHDTHVYVEKAGVTYGSITKQLVSISKVDDEGSSFVRDDSYFISETGVEGLYFAGDYTEILTGADAYVYDLIQNNAIVRVTKTGKRSSATYFAEDYVLTGDYAEATTVGLLKRLAIIDTGEKFAFRDDSGEPVKTFTIEFEPRITGSSATVTFNTGLVYHAPGEFKNNEGFLSSNIHLQDYDYYQPYSYVVSSSKQRNDWDTTFLESTHPAGFKLFSELNLEGEISVTPSVTSSITEVDYHVFLEASDTVTVSESDAKSLTRPISDSATVTDSEEVTLTYLREFFETVTSSEVDSISTSLEKSESVSVSESEVKIFNLNVSESIVVSENVGKQFIQEDDVTSDLQENITVSESVIKSLNVIASSETVAVTESSRYEFAQEDDLTSDLQEDIAVSENSVFQLDKVLSDTVTSSESDAKSFSTPISDNSTVSDSPAKSINVPFTESVTTSEAVDSLNIAKNITETIPVSENVQKHFYQENDISSDLQEDISVTDSPVKSINVPFTETVTTSENVSTLVVIPVNLTDTVTVTDSGISYTFDQQDDVTSDLQDDVSVTDSPAISFSRSVSDAASTSENSVINTNKSLSDSATATDAGGEIFNNSYSPEYFAEQYVGTTYIF